MDTMTEKPAEFPHPYVTVDVLIFSIRTEELSVLLIRRSHLPFREMFAIPGGFVEISETLDQAAKRVIKEKGHQKNLYLEQLFTFGDVQRDPRGRVVSVSYMALVPQDKVVEVSDPRHVVKWFPVNKLPELAFDHREIVNYAVERIKNKVGYSNLAANFLSERFRLSDLQRVFEIILRRPLDKRNFRKKIFSLDLVEPLGEKVVTGKHRPAMLYRFKKRGLIIFD